MNEIVEYLEREGMLGLDATFEDFEAFMEALEQAPNGDMECA